MPVSSQCGQRGRIKKLCSNQAGGETHGNLVQQRQNLKSLPALPTRSSPKAEGIRNSKLANPSVKMFSRAATRTTTTLVSRRAFHATRARMSSPYHYPDGPYTNLPFNPHSKWFGLGYWGFMATGFFAPFGIAVYQTYKSEA